MGNQTVVVGRGNTRYNRTLNANRKKLGFQEDSIVRDGLEQNDLRRAAAFKWKKAEGQTAWIKIALAFLVFYAGEAILFWQGLALATPLMRLIPFSIPAIYPLGYWGLFGVVVYLLQRTKRSGQDRNAAAARFRRWQGALLTTAITTGVIGVTFVVMLGSKSTTLGHVAMFFALFLAAAVLGAVELNVGWLAAAGLWLITAMAIYFYPATLRLTRPLKDEDILLGLAVAMGFFLIGLFPQQVDRGWLETQEAGTPETCSADSSAPNK
jgi:hypothetical protein